MLNRAIVLFGAAALAFAGIMQPAAADQVTLRFNRWLPPTHHYHARIIVGWADRVHAATRNQVKIEFTPASLGAPARQFELAVTGVADVTTGNQAYTAERFVLSRLAELPFLGTSAEALSVAHWRVQQKHFSQADEYKGTKLITVFNAGPLNIFTSKRPVVTVADLKGLKMRASAGTPTEVATALGVVPISGPITEAYESLSRGITDGTFLPPDTIRSFQMEKILSYQLKIPDGLFNFSFFVVMNEAKWNSLPKAHQEAIANVSGESFAGAAGRIWDDQDRIANEQFAGSGMNIATASEGMLNDLRQRLGHIEREWVKQAEARGVDGRAALEMFRREAAAYRPVP